MQPEFIPPTSHTPQKKFSGKLIIIIVSILVALILGAVLLIALFSKNPTASMDRLNARMASLVLYTADAKKNARLDTLRKVNSDASILLSGDATAILTATTAAGAKAENKAVVAAETADQKKILENLKNAAIDARFDREYVGMFKESLAKTQALLSQVNSESRSKNVKTATKNAYDHMSSILDSLEALEL